MFREFARPSQCFHTGGAGLVERSPVSGGRYRVRVRRRRLSRSGSRTASPRGRQLRPFQQVHRDACAAGRNGVRELGNPKLAHQMDVLDLDIAGRLSRIFQQKIDPRALAVDDPAILHLAADGRIADEFGNDAGRESFRDDRVRMHGVDADQLVRAAEIHPRSIPTSRAACAQGLGTLTATPAPLQPAGLSWHRGWRRAR